MSGLWAEAARWAPAAALGVLALGIVASNVTVWLRACARGEYFSLTLILGGALGAAAIAALPWPGSWHWAWLAPLIDPGCFLPVQAWLRHCLRRS